MNRIIAKVVEVADELGSVTPAQVAMNWIRQNRYRMIPVVGARSVAQITDSLGCLDFEIPAEKLAELEEFTKIELGFPHDMLQGEQARSLIYGGLFEKLDNHRRR
ncbi:MAG: hypothetical protein B6D45_10060 [Ignavibacteriales bacterium UTCHB3]|nr:MAG: hypothetical protein B6D45_10060 [Ignavibacteriales bacterium UTCHB3]